MEIIDNKWVWSYNENPNKRSKYQVNEGAKIEWKRNGSRGSVNAKIIGFSDEKTSHVFIENWLPDWSRPYSEHARVWIKKKSVLIVIEH